MSAEAKSATAVTVCPLGDLPPGSKRILQVGRQSLGVFNVHNELFAVQNVCPHRGAQLCLGDVTGTMLPSKPGDFIYGRENEVLTCPWHRWEFDLRTGRALVDPERTRVAVYEVEVRDGHVVIPLTERGRPIPRADAG
jgi:3-phenylpropionate/trans-cinnamate dioxygenase ferredoxin subunit